MPIPSSFPDLKDASVFITGGGSGIGAALVEGFVKEGARVSFVDILDGRTFCDHLEASHGIRPLFLPCDIRDIDQLKEKMAEAAEHHGTLSILVNNAARDDRHEIESLSVAQWDDLMAINLRAQFFAIQAVIPGMKKIGKGSIVNISSNSYLLGLSGYPAYIAAKAAIAGMTKSLARDLGSFHIRVNSLLPGWIMTARQKELWVDEESLAACLAQQSLKFPLQPKDMIAPCLFLASDSSRAITGQCLIADGGRS